MTLRSYRSTEGWPLRVTAYENENVIASATNPCAVHVYPGPASSPGGQPGTGY
jgi:hypothetical protein